MAILESILLSTLVGFFIMGVFLVVIMPLFRMLIEKLSKTSS